MNAKHVPLGVTLAGGILAAAVSGAAFAVPDFVAAPAAFTAPEPALVVAPTNIPRRYRNETIRLSLTVDETGRPRNVELLGDRDPGLVRQLLPVVAQWHFKPAMKNGRPVSIEVVLPLKLVESADP